MANKETTKLILEAVDHYLSVLRRELAPETDVEYLKKIVKFTELKTLLTSEKAEN